MNLFDVDMYLLSAAVIFLGAGFLGIAWGLTIELILLLYKVWKKYIS